MQLPKLFRSPTRRPSDDNYDKESGKCSLKQETVNDDSRRILHGRVYFVCENVINTFKCYPHAQTISTTLNFNNVFLLKAHTQNNWPPIIDYILHIF